MTREEAIKWLKGIQGCYKEKWFDLNLLNELCVEAIDLAIESLSAETEWIPVSERLPEDSQRVLVTIVNYKGDKVVRVAEYYNQKGIFQIKENHEQWEIYDKGLLAWTPLPTPYRERREQCD